MIILDKKTKAVENPFGFLALIPPRPGVCTVCADQHNPALPHNIASLYYHMRFRQEHGRFPTWNDAMEHCTPKAKAFFREYLQELGIAIDAESDADD